MDRATIAMVVLPDRTRRIVKGETTLKRVLSGKEARALTLKTIPVEDETEAETLWRRYNLG